MTPDLFTRAESAAAFVLSQTKLRPQIGLVLGSGLGSFADDLTEAVRIPYADIPTFPRSTAVGHAGQLVVGKSGEIPVAVMQGRVHLYEGYPAAEVAFPCACSDAWASARSSSPTPLAHQRRVRAGSAGHPARSHQSSGAESADGRE